MTRQYQSINPDLLMDAVGNDLSAFRSLSTTFLDIAPPALLRLLAAIQTANHQRIVHESHSLRGTMALVGAHDMVNLLRNIETLANQESIVAIESLQKELSEIFVLVESEVRDSVLHFLPAADLSQSSQQADGSNNPN